MRDKMKESRFKPIEYMRSKYRAVTEEGCDIDTVLDTTYFAHVAHMIRAGDEILVVAEDDSFRMELLVADTGPQWVRTRVLQKWDWSESDKADIDKPLVDAAYRRVWKGPHDLHCIERVSDGMLVQKQIREKGEANKIAANYEAKAA